MVKFVDHEWTKHGTCSGLSQTDYFTNALNVLKTYGTPSVISDNVGKYVSSDTIRASFGGKEYASLVCTSGKYLNGVYMCLNQVNGVPNGKTVCPADVQSEDTCGTGDIFIQTF
jgi:ribonuclease T2